jgi:hypothetical protein
MHHLEASRVAVGQEEKGKVRESKRNNEDERPTKANRVDPSTGSERAKGNDAKKVYSR